MGGAHWRVLQIYAQGDTVILLTVARRVRAVGWTVSRVRRRMRCSCRSGARPGHRHLALHSSRSSICWPPHIGTPRGALLRSVRRGSAGAMAAGLHHVTRVVVPPPRGVDPGHGFQPWRTNRDGYRQEAK
jgi:hypothetical protein